MLTACNAPPAKIEIQPDRVVLDQKGETQALKVVARDHSGKPVEKFSVEWHTMDPAICAVDTAGVVKALKSGECVVRAFVGDLRANAAIRVGIIGAVEVEPSGIVMGMGVTRRFSARVLDDRGKPLMGVGGVAWTTSDPNVATVDQAGNVKTVNEGEVRVVARAAGIEGAAMVVVKTGL